MVQTPLVMKMVWYIKEVMESIIINATGDQNLVNLTCQLMKVMVLTEREVIEGTINITGDHIVRTQDLLILMTIDVVKEAEH